MYVGGGLWEISILFPQFCCEPKTALRYEVYFFKSGLGNAEQQLRTLVRKMVQEHSFWGLEDGTESVCLCRKRPNKEDLQREKIPGKAKSSGRARVQALAEF